MEKSRFFQKQGKEPNYFFIFISKKLFCESLFTIKSKMRNKIIIIIITNIFVIKYGFIDNRFAEKIYQILEIKS